MDLTAIGAAIRTRREKRLATALQQEPQESVGTLLRGVVMGAYISGVEYGVATVNDAIADATDVQP